VRLHRKIHGSRRENLLERLRENTDWDERTGIPLTALPGRFRFHPSHQEHFYQLSNGAEVREDIFVQRGSPRATNVDPPAVYFTIELSNTTDTTLHIATYVFAQLRGDMGHDVVSTFDKRRNAIVAWNQSDPSFARLITYSVPVTSWETTMNHGKAIASTSPATDPLGVLHVSHALRPGARASFSCTVTFSLEGEKAALGLVRTLPSAADAFRATQSYYTDVLNRSVVLTPDSQINAGVIWAKANMLRTMLLAPTGWNFQILPKFRCSGTPSISSGKVWSLSITTSERGRRPTTSSISTTTHRS
jgi:hypothetical protein